MSVESPQYQPARGAPAISHAEPLAPIPDHVDPRLVVDFDYLDPPGLAEHGDIYRSWAVLHDGPDIVWTPRHGGHWILTRAEDIDWAQHTFEIFSHTEFTVPRGAGINLPPATLDPPESVPYRAALVPNFTRARVDDYESLARALSSDLIETLKPAGRCEFVSEFAQVMPVNVFLAMIDLPRRRREEFLNWSRGLFDESTRPEFHLKVTHFLAGILKERAENPGNDILSRIAQFGRSRGLEGTEELHGMAMLVFSGGLDTVAAELSFAMLHLARHPESQRRLRDDPKIIPQAVEELLRRHGLSNTCRIVLRDCERRGVRLLRGDMVMVPVALSGIDECAYRNAFDIDFDRRAKSHNTFGNGPHRCVGEHLARMEFRIFLEEWFRRMPEVRLDPERPSPRSFAGPVEGMSSLHLVWDA